MAEDESGFDTDDHFDTEPSGPGSTEEEPTTTPTEHTTEGTEEPHPEEATIAQLIQEEVTPLREAVETLTEVYIEEPQWCIDLSELINTLIKSIPGESSNKRGDNSTINPCEDKILPAAVSDEIDRLYKIEDAHQISERAERALNLIIDNNPILIKLPDNPDDRLLLMETLNRWYKQAYPDREPLKLSPPGGVPD